ncbi:CatB-related O-acetyltransferase [Micromonospora sp. CPCC 205546]|uniref:acyltransferase n=1 Tax=Micromonospora sp. CPCC 205546 TaxID=3122397 RepID=UPI002FEFD051
MRVDSRQPGLLVGRLAGMAEGVLTTGTRLRRAVRGWATARRFAVRGDRVVFDPDGVYTYENIELGSDVDLGYRPVLMAALSRIRIGSNVMFGPEVTIRGGNHRVDRVGVPMIAVRKQAGDEEHDRGVTIGDDVWVGTRAIILQGVTVGRGAVIGAGAVVTRPVPPYAIVAGNPARVIRLRWPVETIARHERELYPPDQRLDDAELTGLAEFVAPAPRSAPVTNPLTADLHDR